MSFHSTKPPRKRPLDDRLAEREPRPPGDPALSFVQSIASVHADQPTELAALIVGLKVLQKVHDFGQTRLYGPAIASLLKRATDPLTSREVMRMDIEAYEILDWLLDGDPVSVEGASDVAHREGELIYYDPKASTVDLLQRAIEEQFDCQIDYFSRSRGEMNRRRITPRSLDAEIYLHAWCHSRRQERTFRVSRITRCVPLHGRPIQPAQQQATRQEEGTGPLQFSLLDDD